MRWLRLCVFEVQRRGAIGVSELQRGQTHLRHEHMRQLRLRHLRQHRFDLRPLRRQLRELSNHSRELPHVPIIEVPLHRRQ
jgi:hypothetical protein